VILILRLRAWYERLSSLKKQMKLCRKLKSAKQAHEVEGIKLAYEAA